MINAVPEIGDFQFTLPDGAKAGIGYQSVDDAFAFSVEYNGKWGWKETISDPEFSVKRNGAVTVLENFLVKVNAWIKANYGAAAPEVPTDEFEKFLHLIRYNLEYVDGAVRLKP